MFDWGPEGLGFRVSGLGFSGFRLRELRVKMLFRVSGLGGSSGDVPFFLLLFVRGFSGANLVWHLTRALASRVLGC